MNGVYQSCLSGCSRLSVSESTYLRDPSWLEFQCEYGADISMSQFSCIGGGLCLRRVGRVSK